MSTIATTTMSSRGQVVIPESVRNDLGLNAGDQFVVVADKGVVILKCLEKPSLKDFDAIIKKARREARTAGLKRADVDAARAAVRGRK